MDVLNPQSLRAIRLQQCERLRAVLREQLEQKGWDQVDGEMWRQVAGDVMVDLASVPGPGQHRIWRVRVQSGSEVMGLPFHATSFGAAVREANRLFDLTSASENEGLDQSRKRALDEHYGIQREDHRGHP